jgi:hypothetical protein
VNQLQKCLTDAFGKETYRKYVLFCYQKKNMFHIPADEFLQKMLTPANDAAGKSLSEDMHQHMEQEHPNKLQQRASNIQKTIKRFEHIRVYFRMVILLYIVSCLMLIGFELEPIVTFAGLVLMSICFLYKVYEYTINCRCFVDAYLMILYRKVLWEMTENHI